MATSKRKSPKGRRGRQKRPGLLLTGASVVGGLGLQGASALGGVIGRNPSVAGGTAAFLVIFSFVAANALWYQPGAHPHPFLRTRDPLFPNVLGARPAVEEHSGNVTTFKIERQDEADATQTNATPVAPGGQQPSQIVMDIQTELVRRGLYNGTPDGVIGPRTSAAILFFEETVGMPQTGDATPVVLAALRTDSVGPSAVPLEKPPADVTSKASAEDPVAAAIRSAEKTIKTAPTPAKKMAQSAELSTVDLVLKIQKGLSNMAYANVGVDGVPGEQTRTAIRHFQKHYNLPENGEPSEAVLKKLKEIGAL
ncbi:MULTISPECIES: peptidoglycan-binding domain-containing protein [unclassified Rhizobium]|uniref:peptidoglycan-binding domain-containing protein n=1 Tax=unclassified Rhizobium TaxID=2613769 RepID=UPI00160ECCCA|nr:MULTISPECIES: peptidoglycan-binding domain-containing protein [unclassified Rhizobium]MBB3539780.1 peptidoglycan hydrolase-like protein with peptidoglycan-binding domain [Rhizobium sp. BK399]MCS3739211.1 peptidoglycan hydrolase-like protein with peptidoglycan-binding domain [Rhizobium sp. BK661]MCS4090464.1 peptidoglycan hydrolase-like protein with peptidoglycan-binding domain [Rhizobium sp. BK176]